ncbi:MAG: hypothetical protein ACRDGV_08830 [Candidatus Limnocylindria bacterium]
MSVDPAWIRSLVGKQDARHDRSRSPAQITSKTAAEPHLCIERAQDALDVGDHRLDLHHQQET